MVRVVDQSGSCGGVVHGGASWRRRVWVCSGRAAQAGRSEASRHAALVAPVKAPGFDRARGGPRACTFVACWSVASPSGSSWERLSSGRDTGPRAALVVRGEPGVGKSALLDELAAGAGEATVLRTQGLEVEAPLAFAALHRLLRPLTRLRDELPAPQARALRVAFGEEDGPSVEPFLVGVATLSLLTAAAEENLVLCVVDDAHWLDPATAGALLFCARRLGADRVAMVFAARDGAWGTLRPAGAPRAGPDRPRAGRSPRPARGTSGRRDRPRR